MNTIQKQRIEEAAFQESSIYDTIQERNAAYNAAIKVASFALKNQWISVEEALPECDKCHLAMYEDGGIIVAKYQDETWWWQDGFVVGRNTEGDLMYSSSCKVQLGLITHWMMIPTINKEEK